MNDMMGMCGSLKHAWLNGLVWGRSGRWKRNRVEVDIFNIEV